MAVGKTAGAVEYRVKRYQFSRTPDGGLDPAKFVAEWKILKDPRGGEGRPPGRRSAPQGAESTDAETIKLAARSARAKVESEVEKARMARIRRRRAEGRICDVDEASRFFGGLMVTAQESIVTLPAAKATEGAEALGCDAAALEAWLEEVLRDHMASLTAEKLEQSERFRRERGVVRDDG